MSEETRIWEGSSSQIVNLPVFLVCGLAIGACIGAAILVGQNSGPVGPLVLGGLALLPLVYALYRALQTKCLRYEITTERIRLRQGILTKRTDEIELYRIKDYVVVEPLSLRIFGVSNLTLVTVEDANPNVMLRAIPDAHGLKDKIRDRVEVCREKKRVGITEFEADGPQS